MIAPARARRPGAPSAPEEEDRDEQACPFCEGREADTPPEVFALGPRGRKADTPGWRVRVVPNKFPAFAGEIGRQEVVIHTPRHVQTLADLTDGEAADVARVWRSRARSAGREGFTYVHAFVNEGKAAGASLAHGHSQLVWLPETPPAVARELTRSADGCSLCTVIAAERSDGSRVVAEESGLAVLSPYASRGPYELLLAPLSCESDAFASDRLEPVLVLLARSLQLLRRVEGRVPLNAWLHTSPFGSRLGHWHIEVVPRLTIQAGLELGSDLHVNSLPPEEAASRLRATL